MNKACKNKLQDKSINSTYYLVRYYGGSYDDYYNIVIFATNKKTTATKYVRKFNSTLKKWKTYYKQFEENKYGMVWLADKNIEKHFKRWNELRNITRCYYEEVPFK